MKFLMSRRAVVPAGALLAAVALLVVWSAPALSAPSVSQQATKARTFVSTSGVDTNTCGPTDPCRTISRALVETNAGGEVIVLSSGGYGPFTVDKAVTVSAVGVYAGITATTGSAVTVAAGVGDAVTLRGLTLIGAGASRGVDASSFGNLTLERLRVRGFLNIGIYVHPGADANLFLSDSVSSDNAAGAYLAPSAGTLRASVTGSRFERNAQDGLLSQALTAVRDSVAARNGGIGFYAYQGATFELEASSSVLNGTGLRACFGTMRVSETVISGNTTGLVTACAPADLISYGNNRTGGNTTEGTFTSTIMLR